MDRAPRIYTFPDASRYGRIVHKSKIYTHASVNNRVKQMFIRDIEQIVWAYKLSPETINLPASNNVREIQVFTVRLKTAELSHSVLLNIDKAIPSPILFCLQFKGKTRYALAYKRPSEVDSKKWVVSSYFQSEWIHDNAEKIKLPIVLNMQDLYQSFLEVLSPLNFRHGETLEEMVLRADQLRIKKQDAEKLESRIRKEKQFKRKVELNRELHCIKMEMQKIQSHV